MESAMNENQHQEAALDLTIDPESSTMIEHSEEVYLQIHNMHLSESEKGNSASKEEIYDLENLDKYKQLTRYLMLHSLIPSNISDQLRFQLEDIEIPEFAGISPVIHVLGGSIFADDFEEVLEVKEEDIMKLEIETAEFLLSRCVMLGGESTHCNFLLVAAFLSYLVFSYFNDWECFRILYMTEFCFDVLYRRTFWRIFQSEEDYKNLRLFCDEFNEKITLNSTFNDLRNTSFGVHMINNVKVCFHVTCNSFYLKQSEIEMFTNVYSLKNDTKYTEAPNSPERVNALEFFQKGIDDCTFLCATCHSECSNYLEYRKNFNLPSF